MPTLYRQSSTKCPLRQSARTVTACVRLWRSAVDPGVVFGRFVGYGGGGQQEEGCFKYVCKTGAFFLSRTGDPDEGWSWLSERARPSGTRVSGADAAEIAGDIIPIMDPTDAEIAASRGKVRIGAERFLRFASESDWRIAEHLPIQLLP